MTIGETFPNCKCYNIHFSGGESGHLIATLLFKFYYGNLNAIIGELGDSHNRFHPIYQNQDIKEVSPESYHQPYKFINPLDASRPLILTTHAKPDYENFFKKYHSGKIILIEVSKDMVMRRLVNLFFKSILPKWQNVNKDLPDSKILFTLIKIKKIWQVWREKFPQFTHVEDPSKLTNEEIQKIFLEIDLSKTLVSEFYVVPDKFNDNVLKISFRDIIHNMNKTLQTLSDLTQRPIEHHIVDYYKNYLHKQDELIKIKAPWVTLLEQKYEGK